MIEKSVEAIKAHLGGLTAKGYRQAVAALPSIVASMEDDEKILYGFGGMILMKNNGRETVTSIVNLLTNKRYYFTGSDGHSSIFFPQQKSGSVDLKDVHAVTMGTETLQGPYVAFETKNDDYKLMLGVGADQAEAKARFDEVIKMAQKSAGGNATIQAALSPADELKKFKELLDMGVISQEEFNAKKKQLLGL